MRKVCGLCEQRCRPEDGGDSEGVWYCNACWETWDDKEDAEGQKESKASRLPARPRKKQKAAEKEEEGEVEEKPPWELWEDSGFDFSWGPAERGSTAERRAPLPEALTGELTGVVRNQSGKSGNFFIECAKVFDQYQRDACVRYNDIPEGMSIGDAIIFEIDPPFSEMTAPLAKNIRKAKGEARQAILARGFRGKENGKGSKGGWPKGGARCYTCGGDHLARDCPESRRGCYTCGGDHLARDCPENPKGKGGGKFGGKGSSKGSFWGWGKGPSVRMLGVVKKKSLESGRHFVLCQDISDVYNRDAQIPEDELPEGVKIGDRIAFDIDEAEGWRGAPLARNVKILGAGGGRKQQEEDRGDGEEYEVEGEEELEEGGQAEEEQEEEEEEVEEPLLGKEELDDEARLEKELAQLNALEQGDDVEAPAPAGRRKAGRDASTAEPVVEDEVEEPDSLEGWIAMQDTIFGDLPPLPRNWIRIRSKTKGLVYYYNTKNGQSTPNEPGRK